MLAVYISVLDCSVKRIFPMVTFHAFMQYRIAFHAIYALLKKVVKRR